MRYLVYSIIVIIGIIFLSTILPSMTIHNTRITEKQSEQNLVVVQQTSPAISYMSQPFISGILTINNESIPFYSPVVTFPGLTFISTGSPLYPTTLTIFDKPVPSLYITDDQIGTNVFGTVSYYFMTHTSTDLYENPYSSIIAYAPDSGYVMVTSYTIDIYDSNNVRISPTGIGMSLSADGLGNIYMYDSQKAIVRPLVPPNYLTVSSYYKFVVTNLYVAGISSSSQLSQLLSANSKSTEYFNSLFGINTGYNPTVSFNIPFVVYPYSASQKITERNPITNSNLSATFSPLFFIPPGSTTWTDKMVYIPYVIPLFESLSALPPSTVYVYPNGTYKALYNGIKPYKIDMPVMIVADGKIIILSTAITGVDPLTGYFIRQQYPGQQIGWFAGPGVQCSYVSISNPDVKQLSPYSEVFYISDTGYVSATGIEDSIVVNEKIFVVDPYNQVAYLFNITLNMTPQQQTNNPAACSLNVQQSGTIVSVTKYNLQGIISLQNMNKIYIDNEYATKGKILFYSMDTLGNVTVYELDLNTGSIKTYTIQVPSIYGAIVRYSNPIVHGTAGQLLTYVSQINDTYYMNTVIPAYIQGNIPLLNSTQMPTNYTFAYSYAEFPITIYYNGSKSASNVVVILNITDPQILSAIGTPTAQDIRVFINNTYGTDYYAYQGLTYSILQYKPGKLLSIAILLPYINPGNNTIYMYMGYPYAQSVMVPANTLLNQYPVLNYG
ncbi:MAG: hypothetical protein ACP5GJ_02625 [Nanopusillaceae archaeon]